VYLKGKIATSNKVNIIAYGRNYVGDEKGDEPGLHAECDVLGKLIPLKNKKKLENINLLVIRLSKTNKLQSSRPCINCIKNMKTISQRKGYKIQNIYYSDNDENIIKTTLETLEKEEPHFSRFYRNKMKNKLKHDNSFLRII
jgi:hypothetical protein